MHITPQLLRQDALPHSLERRAARVQPLPLLQHPLLGHRTLHPYCHLGEADKEGVQFNMERLFYVWSL